MADTLVRPVRSMTLEDYLALPIGPPFYEFEEGELIALGQPTIPHQRISRKIMRPLEDYVEERNLGLVIQEVDVVLPDGRSYVPDINFVSAARLPQLTPTELRLEGAPDLVVEITSSDVTRDKVHKFRIYFTNGVAWYWIVEQDTLAIEEWRAGAANFELASRAAGGETFRSALFPGLEINLAALLGAAQNIAS